MCLDVQTNKLEAVLLQGHVLQIIILHFVFEKSSEAVIDDIKELIKMNFKNKFRDKAAWAPALMSRAGV